MFGVISVGMTKSLTVIVTESEDAGQTLLVTVHKNLFKPGESPLMPVVGDAGSKILPAPEINDQIPVSKLLANTASIVVSNM